MRTCDRRDAARAQIMKTSAPNPFVSRAGRVPHVICPPRLKAEPFPFRGWICYGEGIAIDGNSPAQAFNRWAEIVSRRYSFGDSRAVVSAILRYRLLRFFPMSGAVIPPKQPKALFAISTVKRL